MKTDDNLNIFLDYYGTVRARLEKKIRAYNREIRRDKNPIIRLFREDLADLNEGGKLLRGMLISLGYRLAGGENPEDSDELALAYEMFQTGILVHDDIIDRAALRRGKITIHQRYRHRLEVRGSKMVADLEDAVSLADSAALCTGDLGLYLANKRIADAYMDNPKAAAIISAFDEIVIDTIRGELLDIVLPYELQDSSYTEEEKKRLLEKSIHDIYHLKTARYSVIGPLHLGMLLAGADAEMLKKMEKAADDLGIAYQIMDDILGIYADTENLGKDVGTDISEFKQTILYMYVKVYAPEAERDLLKVYGRPADEESLEAVRNIFRYSGALDYAKNAMNNCFKRAESKLRKMDFLSENDLAILLGFIDWCRGRRN